MHRILVFRVYESLTTLRHHTCMSGTCSTVIGYSRTRNRWHSYCTWIFVLLNTVIACNCGHITCILYCTDIIILITSHRYIDTVTRDTIISYSYPTDTRIHYFTGYRHFIYLHHRYMGALFTVISCSYIIVTYIHRYTCIDYFYILVVWITILITWIIATWIFMYSHYMIVCNYWYWYSRYWTCELLICDVWN